MEYLFSPSSLKKPTTNQNVVCHKDSHRLPGCSVHNSYYHRSRRGSSTGPSQIWYASFKTDGYITRVTFNNPPINLVNAPLVSDLYDFLASLQPQNRTTPPPKVVIFDSANPDFFLAHTDLNFIILNPTPDIAAASGKYVLITQLLQSITSDRVHGRD